jgi:hypothetical protein
MTPIPILLIKSADRDVCRTAELQILRRRNARFPSYFDVFPGFLQQTCNALSAGLAGEDGGLNLQIPSEKPFMAIV